MTEPKLVLPSLAIPWGRWTVDANASATSALARLGQDNRNGGLDFRARADALASQINGIEAVASVSTLEIPTFTVTAAPSPAPQRVWPSQQFTFNPPRADTDYTVSVIANIQASGLSLEYPRSYLVVNGHQDAFTHENIGNPNRAELSIMGTTTISAGQVVRVNFAIGSANSGTLTFMGCRITTIYNGRGAL